jgi:hypothetical protein
LYERIFEDLFDSLMDYDEKKTELEDAGLDPNDYDF